MSRTSLIKLIHVARRELHLDDDTYRAFLVQCTGKTSCRELSVAQLEQVLDAMKERGFKKQKKHPRRRFKGHVTPREKIYKIWQQMFLDGFVSDISDAALDKYVERLTARRNGGQGVSTLAWCHGESLQVVLETLKQWHMRCIREALARHGVPLPVSETGRELRGYDALTSAYARARNSGRIVL
ncbi:TPA: gp16 family protein [Escherichia coli]|uniref:phage protein GemA/Gp16 family protein n=1 Tax=Escherichia coli TaxID=562 RepID=UPI00145C0F0F|nr:regulatory protein GemA [Escherichia coli]EJN7980390.1 regulatory protein GemA [Escherichia coli]EJT9395625.1 regulatory protein GemA [Escherichia coli]EJU6895033.1 regulatory protein GemA [Escherichia coli]MCZ5371877.1 regulatory protein GemA [Escherichia coli]